MVEYQLLDWIDIDKLHLDILLKYNSNAINLYDHSYDNELLCYNTNDEALDYLINHPEEIEWESLSANNNDKAIELLIKNFDDIDWFMLNSRRYNYIISSQSKNKIEKYIDSVDCVYDFGTSDEFSKKINKNKPKNIIFLSKFN